MKKLITLISVCVVVFILGCSSTVNIGSSERVVRVENESKNVLYVKANNWMVDEFRNADSVIQFSDKESGTISGRYLLGITDRENLNKVHATIKIKVKDGASKIVITPEEFSYNEASFSYTGFNEINARYKITALLASFEVAMKKPEDNAW